jgi:hypothetical protein
VSINSILHDSCTFHTTRSIRRSKKIGNRLSCPALQICIFIELCIRNSLMWDRGSLSHNHFCPTFLYWNRLKKNFTDVKQKFEMAIVGSIQFPIARMSAVAKYYNHYEVISFLRDFRLLICSFFPRARSGRVPKAAALTITCDCTAREN